MKRSNERIHFFIPLLAMILLVLFILSTESGVLDNLIGHDYAPAEEQYSSDELSRIATNELLKIYVTIQPKIADQGKSFVNRLVINGKRKDISVYFENEEDFLKKNIFTIPEGNASLQVRKRSLNEPSYSFKVKLYDKAGLFLGQDKLNIEKYLEDPLRIRNKFGMDLIRELDILEPVNIRFAQLFIRDANKSLSENYYNHGLYFLTEQIDDNFLILHELDPNGALYEIDNYDLESNNVKKAVNNKMERRGRNADKELELILKKINSDLPISEVIDEHFDIDNLLDYMAFSILVQKEDPGEEDYFLFSSLRDKKWYIFSTSYRDTFGNSKDVKWKTGVHVFTENPLFRKIVLNKELREDLIVRVKTLYDQVQLIDVEGMLKAYEPIIMPYLSSLPDYQYMEMPIAEFQEALPTLSEMITENYQHFNQSLAYPMPIRIKIDGTNVHWTPSQSFVESTLYYNLEVSEYPDFRTSVLVKRDIKETNYLLDYLPSGTYYVKVSVYNNQGYQQSAVNRYTDLFGKSYHGIKQIVVPTMPVVEVE